MSAYNKANQPQSLRSLDSLAVAHFVHGFAIFAQKALRIQGIMRTILTVLALLLLCTSCSWARIPASVVEQHKNGAANQLGDFESQFTFVGTYVGVSEESYSNIHGEEWSLIFKVEKVLLGSYDKKIVHIATHVSTDSSFKKGEQYYITMDWGNHGLLLMGHQIKNDT